MLQIHLNKSSTITRSIGKVQLEILVANLVTNFQDLVVKVRNLVALTPVLGAILCPDPILPMDFLLILISVYRCLEFLRGFVCHGGSILCECWLWKVKPLDTPRITKQWLKFHSEHFQLKSQNCKEYSMIIRTYVLYKQFSLPADTFKRGREREDKCDTE